MPLWLWLPLLLLSILAVTVVLLPLTASFTGDLGSEDIQATVEGYWGAKPLLGIFFSTSVGFPEFRVLGRRFGGAREGINDGDNSGPHDCEASFETDFHSLGEESVISPVPQPEVRPSPKDESVELQEAESKEAFFDEDLVPRDTSEEYEPEFAPDQFDRTVERSSSESRQAGSESARESSGPEEDRESKKSNKHQKRKFSLFERLRRSPVVFALRQHRYQMKVMKWLKRVLIAFFRIVRFDRFTLRIKGGIGDPVVTGILYGGITSIKQALQVGVGRPHVLEYEPHFDTTPSFTGNAAVKLHTSIFRILLPLVIALVTFPYLSTVILWLRLRKLGKTAEDSTPNA